MAGISQTRRVFLDSWVLKRLAADCCPEMPDTIRRLVSRGELQIVITYDHVIDFWHDGNKDRAVTGSRFVDSLKPLWMLDGDGIYHREAFSEFLRLTGKQPLKPPFPCRRLSDALRQLSLECPWRPGSPLTTGIVRQGTSTASFAEEVEGFYRLDDAARGMAPQYISDIVGRVEPQTTWDLILNQIRANREEAHQSGRFSRDWSDTLRRWWRVFLTEPPAEPPDADLESLSQRLDVSQMPAWNALISVEKVWYRNKTAKVKPGDVVDFQHLAHLPYVDDYVTEKHQADLIRQAGLTGASGKVHARIQDWAASLPS